MIPRVFRGGDSLQARWEIDVKFDRATGYVKPGRGISLDSDPYRIERFGGAYEVISIPAELDIVNTSGTHFELVPRQAMSLERYQALLNLVVLKRAILE
jgi:hypothetical protein